MRIPFLRGFVPLALVSIAAACAPGAGQQEPESAVAPRLTAAGSQSPAAESGDHSVVIASHLYSTYDPGRRRSRAPRLAWTEALEAFAGEVERIDPRQLFLLGDNTRNGRDEEWELLERVFAPLKGRVQYGAGNHDANRLDAFEEHGGVRYGSKQVGRNKYIQLDCVKVLDDEALAFLDRELADSESYEHVFLLMHYFLAGWEELPEGMQSSLQVPEGEDPNASARLTNWQRDVVPMIAGKVDVVFVGDYCHDHVRSTLQRYDGHEIRYVLNSFGYGFDEGVGVGSDGPLVFLELRFEGDDFRILPRTVPLDMRSGSYGFALRTEMRSLYLDWVQIDFGDPAAGVGYQLAHHWRVERGQSAEVEAWVPDPINGGRLEYSVRSIPLESEDEAGKAKAAAAWMASIVEGDLKVLQNAALPVGGVRGLWAKVVGELDGQQVGRWSQVVIHRGKAWVFSLTVQGELQLGHLQLWEFLLSSVVLTH